MKGIEIACEGVITRAAEPRVSKKGREWLTFQMVVTIAEDAEEILQVAAFAPDHVALAPILASHVEVYVEGKLRLRRWKDEENGCVYSQLCVSASKIELIGLIGNRRPRTKKKPRADSAPTAAGAATPFNDPLPF